MGPQRGERSTPESPLSCEVRSRSSVPLHVKELQRGGGVIRTREGRIRPLTAFEAVPFVRSGTPPSASLATTGWPGSYLRSLKKSRRICPHSSCRNPPKT